MNPTLVALLGQVAAQLRTSGKDAGTVCDLPGCDALTLGVRCVKCARRVCMGHSFFRLSPKPEPHCPFCVVEVSSDVFADEKGRG